MQRPDYTVSTIADLPHPHPIDRVELCRLNEFINWTLLGGTEPLVELVDHAPVQDEQRLPEGAAGRWLNLLNGSALAPRVAGLLEKTPGRRYCWTRRSGKGSRAWRLQCGRLEGEADRFGRTRIRNWAANGISYWRLWNREVVFIRGLNGCRGKQLKRDRIAPACTVLVHGPGNAGLRAWPEVSPGGSAGSAAR